MLCYYCYSNFKHSAYYHCNNYHTMNSKDETVGVVGYIVSTDGRKAVLIKKDKPDWQAGKYNGIGGKMEQIDGGMANVAMVRECLEETGVSTEPSDWIEVTIERFPNYTLHVFYTVLDCEVSKQSGETEEPRWMTHTDIKCDAAFGNLVNGVVSHLNQIESLIT